MSSADTVGYRSIVDHNGPGPIPGGLMARANISEGLFLYKQCVDSDQISVKVHFYVPVLLYIL